MSSVRKHPFEDNHPGFHSESIPHTSESCSIPCALPSTSSSYIDNGDCTYACEYCSSYFWYDERTVWASNNRRPRYNQCCKGGRVKLEPPKESSLLIKCLFDQSSFLDKIGAYNSMFSMTSFGAKIDDSINNGSGPYVFKIEGQVHHWIGALCPPENEKPRFLQMYIYDTEHETVNRLRFFGNDAQTTLESETVDLLTSELERCNELVKLFRTARDLCNSLDVPRFSIRLYNYPREHCYNTPTSNTIGAIIHESEPASDDFDIIIRHKTDGPKRVSKLHPLYMALQYPLLFIYGESGWSPNLRLHVANQSTSKQLTMNMFYSYQIHDRASLYTLLLRAGRLFQQYLVDAYVCIEQNRLEYVRQNQNILRNEYLQGIHDAVLRGDTEGRDIGMRTILSASFTGGPRYMYKHYQDALAICRVHGNPQYFITFTCNVKWPEITRYLAQYSSIKAQDRPDIIARIFRIKVDSLIKFLRSGRPFGCVVADLYTIEFQKRGLPHCHLLLWVSQSCRIRNADQLDNYISAEIPDPVTEPHLHKVVTDFMMHGPCGLAKPNASCMSNGSCSRKFPKAYESTTKFDKNGYAHYRRRPTVLYSTKNGVRLDNTYVVPYNKDLCARYHAHINVEYCGWSMMIKYLFMYISKGVDRIRFTITKTSSTSNEIEQTAAAPIDEIKNFVDARYVCPHEAA